MKNAIARQARAFLLALQFLTTLPVPASRTSDASLQGLSLLWYPAVGLLLGGALLLFCAVLPLPFYLQAMLTVALWIALTGGLHLDGLADCADAWVGGLGDRDRTLQILKDPLCGSMGVIALVTLITLKALAVAAVIERGQLQWLWLVPLFARQSLPLLFLTTDYVRPQGLGEILARDFSRQWARRVLLGTLIATAAIVPFTVWLACTSVSLAILLLVRRACMQRLGGFTGDVAGAQVECIEVGLLLVLAGVGTV
jgi:adenosylcobinamide-GDP ribazoletransferase